MMMKYLLIILASLQLALGQTTTSIFATPANAIYGIDFLGWGFDATYRDEFFALKPQLFNFTWGNNAAQTIGSYRYPTNTDTWSVPDQVFVRTIAKTETFTYIFTSSEQERRVLDLKLNIQGSAGALKSGTLNVGFTMVNENEQDKFIIQNVAETSLYQLYISTTRVLSDQFQKDLSKLAATYSLDPESYNQFIYKYGTHYVDSIIIGGAIKQRTIVSNSSSSDVLRVAVVLNAQLQSATGNSANIDFSLEFNQTKTRVETSTTSSSEVNGGDPEFTDFVLSGGAPDSAKQLFGSWKASLVTNPVGIRYRLVEIWQLLSDKLLQKEMCKAIGTQLGFLPDENPNWCSKTSQILSGTIQGVTNLPA